MPFITEEIWQRVAPLAGERGARSWTSPFRRCDASRVTQQSRPKCAGSWILLGVRRIRGELDIAPSAPLVLCRMLGRGRRALRARAPRHCKLGRHRGCDSAAAGQRPPQSAAACSATCDPRADGGADRRRCGARPARQAPEQVEQELARATAKLEQRELRAECARRGGRAGTGARSRRSSVNWRNLPNSTSG